MAATDIPSIDAISSGIRRQPFVPFAIVMSSGQRVVIESGEWLAISASQLHYYPPRADRAVHLSVNEIVSVVWPA